MNETPMIRDERLGRFKSAQRLVDSIRELDRQIRLTEESGMTVDQAVMVMSVLDTTEPEILEVIASVITKLSGNVPDKDPDPTPEPDPEPETPDEPEPEPETPDTPDTESEPESNEETLNETPVESETAEAVDESLAPDPELETPEETEDTDRRTITVEGCIHPITVTKDGDVFIDGVQQDVLYNTRGYAFLKLPGASRQVRVILHSLVMQAFRPTMEQRQVVHKNGNQRDCRLENLAYRGEIKMDNPSFDASDALEASLALVDTNFNVGEAVNLLGMRKKRASYDLVRKIMNKEIFTEVSDRYFDARLHVVKDAKTESAETTETETTTTETTVAEVVEKIKEEREEKTALIEKALADSENKIRDAYKLLVKQGHPEITLYEIFNVKNGGAGDPPDDDVVELIRYAKKGGATDIRYTLLSECNLLNISQRQFNKATRR